MPPPIAFVELLIVADCVKVVADPDVSRRPPETLVAEPETTPIETELIPAPFPKLETLPDIEIELIEDAEPEILEIDGLVYVGVVGVVVDPPVLPLPLLKAAQLIEPEFDPLKYVVPLTDSLK
jgi:hypothetical protein